MTSLWTVAVPLESTVLPLRRPLHSPYYIGGRSPELKIDRLRDLDQFGALILDTYGCEDEDVAFERLRDFSQHRSLVLLSSDTALFRRIRSRIADFPLATIVVRAPEVPGEWLRFEKPSFHYGSSAIRRVWTEIQRIIDQRKVAVEHGSGDNKQQD